MIENKRVIGVCVTKVQDSTRCEYIEYLYRLAAEQGYKLIVFNSFMDFYYQNTFDEGAKSVYDIINYDIIDALVILSTGFHNRAVVEEIKEKAKARKMPVLLVNDEAEDCYCVVGDYESAFKSVVNHVIREHGVTDTFFIAGNKEGDPVSAKRLQCYKEVLEENGIAFDENKVDYGEYWSEPTKQAVRRRIESGEKPPRAVICANDYMAMSVCEVLKEYGYRIPEDVIVTGFDGISAAGYFNPGLTTCNENLEGLAALSFDVLKRALDEKIPCGVFKNEFQPCISESCGCKRLAKQDFRGATVDLCRFVDEMEMHEDSMYAWIDRMLEVADMKVFYSSLAKHILKNSYVCLNQDFIATAMGNSTERGSTRLSDGLVVIASKSEQDIAKSDKINLADMVPNMQEWLQEDTLCVLTSIYVGNEVCGYYAVKTNALYDIRQRIKRVSQSMNIVFNATMSYLRQKNMKLSIENAALMNQVTGLPNLKGLAKWFEEFSANMENRKKPLSVSVYGLPKYTYIYENYGIEDVEEALRFVAEALRIANTTDCYIAHIAEDEFVVINYFSDTDSVSDTINSATSVFYSVVEGFNANSKKDYYVEINCGCTVIDAGWEGALESFIKIANSEMYMNRLKMGTGAAVKEKFTSKDNYKAFELLIEKNLFHYYFQPIVNAKNGEIYAYEALMRTDASIGMNPFEVLETAKEYNRLYEIEKATMFNVMERFVMEREKFGNRKVFINTIPGYFLNAEDNGLLVEKYGVYMGNFIFELTEQDTVSDEELNAIKRLNGEMTSNQVAIDDYGTGHSNIMNLMRYAPQIIKIDRFLIEDIHKNQNKQLFVRSTIEFARLNNIKVLAEGVETSNELRMVIDLGVDYIQGYYTGRPVPEPITEIDPDIRKEILDALPLFGCA